MTLPAALISTLPLTHRPSVDPALYPPTVQPPDGPLPMYKFLPAFLRNPLRSLPRQVYENLDAVSQRRGNATIVWVTAPDLIEQLLVRDADKVIKSPVEKRVFQASLAESILLADGAEWRWQRRALAPLFRPADVASYVPDMARCAEAQVARWREASRGRAPGTVHRRAIDEDMMRATFEVILATMLVGGRPAEAETIMKAGSDYLARASWDMAYAIVRLPEWLPHPAKRQMARAADAMRGAIGAIIARRRAEGGSRADLLGRLLEARHPDTGEPMAHDLIVSNLLTLLEAGHETTAKALTWTLYLLARAPQWQQRVSDEVRAVAGDAPITADHVTKLVVTQKVIKESMRLYPPAPVIGREVVSPIELAGLTVKPGSQVVVPIYAVHRHRKLWTDPDRFDPERFQPEAEAVRPRTQYMPFGGGARVCIGAGFALIEATVLLATFIRGARFEWDGQHKPEPISRITLRPDGGMPLHVAVR